MDGRWPSSERRSTIGGSDCATKQRCSSGRGTRAWSSWLTSTMATRPPRCRPHGSAAAASAAAEMAPKKLAGVGAMLAMTIADLHDRAIVHRRITSDHVLLDGLGRVVLVGFGDASASPGECETADDVAAIGAALEAKLPTDLAAIAKVRTSPADRQVVERLRAVLARARDPEPSRRPSARALSGLLTEIAGEPVSGGPIRLPRPTSADSAASAAPHPLAPAYAAARAALGQLRPRVATRAWADPVGARGHPDRRLRRSCRARERNTARAGQPSPGARGARHDRDERDHRRIEQHQLAAGVADIGALPSARAGRRAA